LGLIALARVIFFPPMDYDRFWMLSLTVSLSVIGVVLYGTLMGSMLPFILRFLGFDPAFSSNPLIATLCDSIGVAIYFSLAILILSGV